jgi:hypothetical protein
MFVQRLLLLLQESNECKKKIIFFANFYFKFIKERKASWKIIFSMKKRRRWCDNISKRIHYNSNLLTFAFIFYYILCTKTTAMVWWRKRNMNWDNLYNLMLWKRKRISQMFIASPHLSRFSLYRELDSAVKLNCETSSFMRNIFVEFLSSILVFSHPFNIQFFS